MRPASLPDEVRRFILTSIPSVPYLEAVLLMRNEAGRTWDAPQLARRLYVPDRHAAELLDRMAAAGVAVHEGEPPAYRYHPATAELRERIDVLAREYAANLLAVTDLIHSRIDKRAQQFADGFRWRKD